MHLLSRPPAEKCAENWRCSEAIQNTLEETAIFLPFRAAEFDRSALLIHIVILRAAVRVAETYCGAGKLLFLTTEEQHMPPGAHTDFCRQRIAALRGMTTKRVRVSKMLCRGGNMLETRLARQHKKCP